jgi:ABC-type Fe3+ transport system substrate-binding protein
MQIRRYSFILLFLFLLFAPLVMRRLTHADAEIVSAGSTAPERLVIITPHAIDIRDEFRWAFADWHLKKYGQSVAIDYLNPGGTNDVKRQLDTIYREIKSRHGGELPPEDQISVGIDIAWGGGDSFFNGELKPLGILRPIDLTDDELKAVYPSPTLAGVKLYDQSRNAAGQMLPTEWVGVCLSSFGIVYNPDLYDSMLLTYPRKWADLTLPNLAGSLSLADPTHSGSASVAYMMVLQRAMVDAEQVFFDQPENKEIDHAKLKMLSRYAKALDDGWKVGMRQLLLMGANCRFFVDSSPQGPIDVASGDAAAGMAIDFYALVTQESVGPHRMQYVAPVDATAITPDPVAILYGTQGERLTLAKHFVEFLLSPEGQRLWILKPGEPGGPRQRALWRAPVRRDVYRDRNGWAYDAHPFETASSFNERSEWFGTFSDLRGLWAASWVDDRDDLRGAYQAVLAVKDESRRAQLLEELSDLPITRSDVSNLMLERKKVAADPKQDLDIWSATQRLKWSRLFAEHYKKVAEEAKR